MKRVWQDVNIAGMLLELGEDLEREGLLDTPDRVVRAWQEFLSGYTMDVAEILSTTFAAEGNGVQICHNIEFTSMCEHHLLPFFGHCTIAYWPRKLVCGLSKLARLVDCFGRRLQIQERMSQQIAQALYEAIDPIGVCVVIRAKHLCCHGRGVKRNSMSFVTTAQCGEVDSNLLPALLQETK